MKAAVVLANGRMVIIIRFEAAGSLWKMAANTLRTELEFSSIEFRLHPKLKGKSPSE